MLPESFDKESGNFSNGAFFNKIIRHYSIVSNNIVMKKIPRPTLKID
jgi:hypothetical protein